MVITRGIVRASILAIFIVSSATCQPIRGRDTFDLYRSAVEYIKRDSGVINIYYRPFKEITEVIVATELVCGDLSLFDRKLSELLISEGEEAQHFRDSLSRVLADFWPCTPGTLPFAEKLSSTTTADRVVFFTRTFDEIVPGRRVLVAQVFATDHPTYSYSVLAETSPSVDMLFIFGLNGEIDRVFSLLIDP